jgi:protein-disulfide isomerase/uncharacterized membrane protein
MPRKIKEGSRTPNQPRAKPLSSAAVAGVLFLLIAVSGSAMMSAKHIWALSLPGCGPGAGCDWAIRSAWSSVFGFPVAFLGLAFFVASLVFRVATVRKNLFRPFLYAVRFGAIVSVGFMILMIGAGHLCVWCLSIHFSNLLWWSALELTAAREPMKGSAGRWEVVIPIFVFLAVVTSAGFLESRYKVVVDTEARAAAAQSISRIGLPQDPTAQRSAYAGDSSLNSGSATSLESHRFGGRYWTGNPNADVRVVVFQDYQCELCKEVEGILSNLLKTRTDLALSVKQWPFDKSCNTEILGENLHPGSCLAARYVEAAGKVGGEKAFWGIHYWLVAQGGRTDTNALKVQLSMQGVDWVRFVRAEQNHEIDSIISADIAQGVKLGLKYTPMVFVNGYQVEGWQTAGALPAAIERAAEMARLQPKPSDQPDAAIDRQFSQWLAQPVQMMVVRNDDHIHGRLGAPTAVLIYGDISDPYNAAAYNMLEPWMKDTSKVCVIFRTFPLQPECNDMVKRQINGRACEAAQTAEAAAIAGGEPSFWKALKWLSDICGKYPKSLVNAASSEIGVSEIALTRAISDTLVGTRIRENVESAKLLGIDTSPTIYVNGRILRDWRTPGMLDKVIKHTVDLALMIKTAPGSQ